MLGIRAEDGPSASKLQVYREAFAYFMDDFKTYRPLLSAIKNEYELLLDKYISRLHYIPPLKARLSTLTQETQQRIHELNASHAQVKSELEGMKEELENSNAKLVSENSSLEKENQDLNKNLISTRKRYEEMVVNNKTLVALLARKAEETEKNEMHIGKHDATVSKLQVCVYVYSNNVVIFPIIFTTTLVFLLLYYLFQIESDQRRASGKEQT